MKFMHCQGEVDEITEYSWQFDVSLLLKFFFVALQHMKETRQLTFVHKFSRFCFVYCVQVPRHLKQTLTLKSNTSKSMIWEDFISFFVFPPLTAAGAAFDTIYDINMSRSNYIHFHVRSACGIRVFYQLVCSHIGVLRYYPNMYLPQIS